MGKPKPPEDLIIPPQDSRICGTICLCQMTAVLSSVALIYLTVAVYMPTLRAFNSGIAETPVMCTTTLNLTRESCDDWATCGEWCLSKSSGLCTQIYVDLRRNGSSLSFANCTNSVNKTCYGIDQDIASRVRCVKDECRNLTGTYNCTKGYCINITDAFECNYRESEPSIKCSGRRGKLTCQHVHGLYTCDKGNCEKILAPYNCDRRCSGIPTRNKNIILLSGDKVYLSQCQKVMMLGTGTEVWTEDQDNVMMASCYTVDMAPAGNGLEATDCINGTVISKDSLEDVANFTYLLYLSVYETVPLDKTGTYVPPEADLIMHNSSHLQINLEGCVNTLKGECDLFHKTFGKDGSDHNARSRFPCFYTESNLTTVVARFDLDSTYQNFLVMSLVPSVLFLVSCSVLATCQRTVEVGDDSKMRFKKLKIANIILPPGDKGGSLNDLGEGGGNSVMAL